MRICNKCKIEKEDSEFNKDKRRKCGLNLSCRICRNNYLKNYRKSDKYQKYLKKFRQSKEYKEYQKKYNSLEKYKELRRRYGQSESFKKAKKKYLNSEKGKKTVALYYKTNTYKNSRRKYQKKYRKRRKENDPQFKLSCLLRTRLWEAINKNWKVGSAVKDLGCSIKYLKEYLEKQFQDGMNWSNHGKWHIDHKKPLTSFNLINRKEFLQAVHYTNLQPLWAKDNIRKFNKLI